jgi:tRNA(Ile)-lysidine synthase TilS/MesJ
MKKRNSSVNKTIHNFYLSKLKNPKIKKLYSRFKRIISKDTDKNYCVAISGGPDSMALAFLTRCLSIERGTSNVYFHIDHKLRKESKKEALFIKKICYLIYPLLYPLTKIPKEFCSHNGYKYGTDKFVIYVFHSLLPVCLPV